MTRSRGLFISSACFLAIGWHYHSLFCCFVAGGYFSAALMQHRVEVDNARSNRP